MEHDFGVGDVVQLKSGGEKMTIEEVDGENVSCVWFDGKRAERSKFSSATLKKCVPTPLGSRLTRG